MDATSTIDTTIVLDRALPAIVIHTALRRELRLAGPLVRRVAAGDVARAAAVADHLDVVLAMLEHHHENEDELAFPPLAARTAGADAALVTMMEDQHAELERQLERVAAVLPTWRAASGGADADALARALDGLHDVLVQHLDLEERALLPLAERLLTEAEWEAIARHGEQGAKGRTKLLVLGMLVHEGDPAVLATMLSSAPLPVRKLLPRLARRTYRRHAIAIHGTPTP